MIPNSELAIVDMRKLTEYCLCPTHFRGRHKAIVFASALGITVDNAEVLQLSLLNAVKTQDARIGELDEFGQRYTIIFDMSTDVGSAEILSGWIIRTGEDFPRLVSAYVV